MKYTIDKTVSPCDLDAHSVPFPSFYLRCMQEVAHLHMTAYPPSPEQLRDEHKRAFILSRAAISVYRPLRTCEKIRITTWASPTRGASFPRNVEISVEGDVVARISSIWALVNTEDHSICHPTDYPCSYTTEPPLETEMPIRFRIPACAELEFAGEYTPHYSDIDLNRHVNNTRYPDIMFGFIPKAESLHFNGISLNYLHEAQEGETLKIFVAKCDGVIYIRSVRPNGEINVELQINL